MSLIPAIVLIAVLPFVIAVAPASARDRPPPSFAAVVQAVAPAVVTITALPTDLPDDFGLRAEAAEDDAIGSGVIIDPAGVVLTNAHVADGADTVEVITADGRRYRPARVALDTRSNLAVLTIGDGSTTFPHARLGDSDRVQVGDWVLAIGSPLGLEATVTAGIVSARTRQSIGHGALDFLQTTAVVRAGSSGGPLVNVDGEVVGINTVFALESFGIAFTIPSNTARAIATQLVERGRVSRPSLGILAQTLSPGLAQALNTGSSAGVLVADVLPGGPGAAAGLRSGDLLLALEGRPLQQPADLARGLAGARVDQSVTLRVRTREGRERTVKATLVEEGDEPASSLVVIRLPELGCEVRSITPELGVVIVRADARIGSDRLRPGDVVRELNNVPVRTVSDLVRLADGLRAGEAVALLVQRGQTATYVAFTAARR